MTVIHEHFSVAGEVVLFKGGSSEGGLGVK